MSRMKVVVCDYEFPHLNNEKRVLSQLGDVQFVPAQCKTEQDVIELTEDADGVINQYSLLNEKVINSMQKCKVISTYGIGVDKINIQAATNKGIYVCNVPDYCINEVADHAMAMLLALTRQIIVMDKNTKNDIWGYKYIKTTIHRIEERTAGIIGFGKIAKNLANKLKAFDINILIYDPYVDEETANKYGVKKVEFNELLCNSDYIFIHVPLTSETMHLIDDDQFKIMKESTYLINVGRGPIVREESLLKALQNGWIAGAGVDVLETEPINSDNPILKLDNVILTPHAAWYSEESLTELQTKATEEVVRVLKGEKPRSAVNIKSL